MKSKMDTLRIKTTAFFKKFESFIEKRVKRANSLILEKLNALYGGSLLKKGIFLSAASLVLILVLVSVTMTISNFSIQAKPALPPVPGGSVSSALSEEISSNPVSVTTPTTTPAQKLTGLSVVKQEYNVNTGKTIKIGVVYTPDAAANKTITWSSSNPAVATVDSSGTVTGKSEGTCTVTGISAENPALAITVTINVKKVEDTANKYLLRVYKGSQSVVAYTKDKNGEYTVAAKAMACSTGTSGNETPTTTFKILRKFRWKELMGPTWEQYCSSLSSSYLFHSVPYNKKNDPSSLSTGAYNALGRKASHGCIRLACIDAKWIYDNCPIGTKVEVVTGSGPKGKKVPLNSDKYYAGWDPTDPNPKNPYNIKPPAKTTTTAKPTTTKPTTTTKKTTPKPTTPKPTTPKPTTPKPTTPKPTTPKPTTPRPTTTPNTTPELPIETE